MRIDVNAWIGHYPFRRITGGGPESVAEEIRRHGIDRAWLSNLGAVYWRDPTEGNAVLYRIGEAHPELAPIPAVHPGLAHRDRVLAEANERGVPAVRIDPLFQGVDPLGAEATATFRRAGQLGLPVVMAVRLEDGRQRHPADGAGDLTAAMLRGIVRASPETRFLVTHADRDLIEQVMYGSTAEEQAQLLWDICWIWGPPMDDLAHLVAAFGASRFAFGTGFPLRLAESAIAKLDLLACTLADRSLIEGGNAARMHR